MTQEAVRVFLRVRPPLQAEEGQDVAVSVPSETGVEVAGSTAASAHYDGVFAPGAGQQEVFDAVTPTIDSVLDGVNCTVFAYGQTGTGKTYTMLGDGADARMWRGASPAAGPERWGLIPRSVQRLFDAVASGPGRSSDVAVTCSYIQIYNNKLYDLLADGARKHALSIHESPAVTPQLLEGGDRGVGDVYVRGLSEVRVTSLRDVLRLLHSGARNRSTRETDVNEQSSRSHAILQLSVRSTTASADGATLSRRAKFNMVDLAGSERWQPRTAMTSAHTRELRAINSSLSALGNVIAALTDASRKHVPYRDSKLTRLLQDSLGGNTRTVLVATVSPCAEAAEETLNTMAFADRAKRVMTRVAANEIVDDALLLKRARAEIARLRSLLLSQSDDRLRGLETEVADLRSENRRLRVDNADLRASVRRLMTASHQPQRRRRRRRQRGRGGGVPHRLAWAHSPLASDGPREREVGGAVHSPEGARRGRHQASEGAEGDASPAVAPGAVWQGWRAREGEDDEGGQGEAGDKHREEEDVAEEEEEEEEGLSPAVTYEEVSQAVADVQLASAEYKSLRGQRRELEAQLRQMAAEAGEEWSDSVITEVLGESGARAAGFGSEAPAVDVLAAHEEEEGGEPAVTGGTEVHRDRATGSDTRGGEQVANWVGSREDGNEEEEDEDDDDDDEDGDDDDDDEDDDEEEEEERGGYRLRSHLLAELRDEAEAEAVQVLRSARGEGDARPAAVDQGLRTMLAEPTPVGGGAGRNGAKEEEEDEGEGAACSTPRLRHSRLDLGARVQLYRFRTDEWVAGTVIGFDPMRDLHRLRFDHSGARAWHSLRGAQVRVLSARAEAAAQPSGGAPSVGSGSAPPTSHRGAGSTFLTVAALRGTRASPAVAAAAAASPYAVAPGAHTKSQAQPKSPPPQPKSQSRALLRRARTGKGQQRRRAAKHAQSADMRPVSGAGVSAARHLASAVRPEPAPHPRSAAGVRDTTLHAEAYAPLRPRSRQARGQDGRGGAYSPVGKVGARFSRNAKSVRK